MRQTALFLAEVVRGLLAIVVTLALAALIIGLLMRTASAAPNSVKGYVKGGHYTKETGRNLYKGGGHYDVHPYAKWNPPPHVLRYRGEIRHPRYYRRPSCLRSWTMWVETGSPYWRVRYLDCVL